MQNHKLNQNIENLGAALDRLTGMIQLDRTDRYLYKTVAPSCFLGEARIT
ncbi:MAG: hypothetical protein KCHDKBKB_01801 [Elusimicrobia bacterium]|nr:hypothetical protein [Elusimicrobiota bacterium]